MEDGPGEGISLLYLVEQEEEIDVRFGVELPAAIATEGDDGVSRSQGARVGSPGLRIQCLDQRVGRSGKLLHHGVPIGTGPVHFPCLIPLRVDVGSERLDAV